MWLLSLRDLQWRRRRFLIAVVATSLTFALTFGELAPTFGLQRSAGARAADGGATVTGYSVKDFRHRARP